uniref:Uncharacterized protein n=1 Tax=Panagrolaimus superbus TaxID=310955 RepID=A0A914YPS4_9BILA
MLIIAYIYIYTNLFQLRIRGKFKKNSFKHILASCSTLKLKALFGSRNFVTSASYNWTIAYPEYNPTTTMTAYYVPVSTMASSTANAHATYTLPQFSASAYGHPMQHYPAFGSNPLAGIATTTYRPNFYSFAPLFFGPPPTTAQFAPHPTTSAADVPQNNTTSDVNVPQTNTSSDVSPTTSADSVHRTTSSADVTQSAANADFTPTTTSVADAPATISTEKSTSAASTTSTASATAITSASTLSSAATVTTAPRKRYAIQINVCFSKLTYITTNAEIFLDYCF